MVHVFSGDSFADVYSQSLRSINNEPDYVTSPRGMKIKESLNCVLHVKDPLNNLYDNVVRSSPIEYVCKELVWYFDGNPDVTYIGKHASLWKNITNPDSNEANSNYGYLVFRKKINDIHNSLVYTQFYWAFKMLKEDKDSRQSIMHFNGIADCQYLGVKDFVCTLTAAFHIREDQLHMTVLMRSQDLIFGLPADFAWFSVLYQQMFSHLKDIYPELQMGSYTHMVHSLHLYEKHFDLANKMLSKEFYPLALPPLKENLVTVMGNPTKACKDLIWSVINKYDFESNDGLIQMIFDRAAKGEF